MYVRERSERLVSTYVAFVIACGTVVARWFGSSPRMPPEPIARILDSILLHVERTPIFEKEETSMFLHGILWNPVGPFKKELGDRKVHSVLFGTGMCGGRFAHISY